VERVRAGRSTSLLVTGLSGSGKSMLLQRVVADARATGFHVLEVVGGPGLSDTPFGSLAQSARLWSSELSEAALAEHALRLERAALGLTTGGPVFAAFEHLLEALEFRGPVLVAVDDLQLVDPRSTELVLHIVRTMRRRRVLPLLTLRTVLRADEEVIDELWREHDAGHLDALELGPFDAAELAALVEAHAGRPPDEALVELLMAQTGGMPFFAAELVKAVVDQGLVERADGRVSAASPHVPLPHRVSTFVLHRVFVLGADARRVATTLAVLGAMGTDRLDLLATVTGLGRTRTDAAFDRLVRSGILEVDAGVYRFSHAIVREALEQDFGPAATRALHASIAQALSADREAGEDVDILELAAHVAHGISGRDRHAATLLREAGDALALMSPAGAVEWYRAALARLGPGDPAVTETQVRLGQVLLRSGLTDDAYRIVGAILPVMAPGRLRGKAAVVAALALATAGRFVEAAAVLDDALSEEGTRSAHLALHRAQLCLWAGDDDEMEHRVAEALELGCRDDDALLTRLHMHAAAGSGRFADAHAAAERLRAMHPTVPDVARTDSVGLVMAFNFDPGRALADVHGEAGPRTPLSLAAVAWAHLRLGQLDAAVESATAAGAADEGASTGFAVGFYAPVLITAHAERGDWRAAEEVESWVTAPAHGAYAAGMDVARARRASLAGDHQRAAAVLRGAVAGKSARGRVPWLAFVLAEQVEAAAVAGDHATARAANTRLQSLRRDDTAVALTMYCLLADATVRRTRQAVALAREHAEQHGLRLDAARAMALAGEIAGDPEALTAAHDAFAQLGAVPRQRRVGQQLRALGRRAPHSRRATRSLLTAVESEVAAHVADGLTNRQVAERMNLSPKTIEVYLTRVYAKTGCRSRVELAVAVHAGALGTPA